METKTDNDNLKDDKKTDNDSQQTRQTRSEHIERSSPTVTAKNEEDQQIDVVASEPLPKKLKLDESVPSAISATQKSSPAEGNSDDDSSIEMLEEKKYRIKTKEDLLHKLQKVEFYKKKWNVEELKKQTNEWKEVAIATFEDLFQKSRAEKESLTKEELLEHLGLNPDDVLGLLGSDVFKI